MNFLDSYEVSGAATPPRRDAVPEPTLNEEVSQVVGQLGRLWGGFRKQSQSVFESARKEVEQVVTQASKELTKLNETTPEEEAATSTEKAPEAGDAEAEAGPSSLTSSTTSTESETATTPTSSRHARGASVSDAAQNLFSRLQSALPSDLASTVQAKLPDSIKQSAGSVDFAQLRSTLASEFQRVQGLTKAQAEEYVHKSEELLRDAGEFLKDAVKVVPPDENAGVTPGVMWDGSDIWMLPEMGTPSESKGKGKELGGKSSAEGLRAVATRAEALLKQLKHDPEIIKTDPEADERLAQMWKEWLSAEVDSTEEGIASEKWKNAKEAVLSEPVDGEALKTTFDTLVPSVIASETFWKRYFFRVYQVSREEQRRKAIIQGTVDNEEEFDWESDDEEATSPTTKLEQPHIAASEELNEAAKENLEDTPTTKLSATSTPVHVSPRHSESEDGSYDVVSEQVSNNGESKEEDIAASKAPTRQRPSAKETEEGDEEDSDWE